MNREQVLEIQSTLDNSKLAGLSKNFKLPSVRMVKWFEISIWQKKFRITERYDKAIKILFCLAMGKDE